LAALALAATAACSSGSDAKPTITVTPSEWTVVAGSGQTQQFTATLTNGTGVISWSIETEGAPFDVGTIVDGLYTPPPTVAAPLLVVVRAAAAGAVGRARVFVLKDPVPPEPPPDPEPVVTSAAPVSIEVFDASALPTLEPVTGFRWVIEEDAMRRVVPGQPAVAGVSPSLSLHPSYMPVVASGFDGYATNPKHAVTLDSTKRYFVSVLPNQGYQMGGAAMSGGDASVRVFVQRQPIPTAQITIFAFRDDFPLNNAPDLPQEQGLAGFKVLLAEAGGTYGASGGQVMQDAFGNPIGTEYQQNPDGSFVLDAEGNPAVLSMGTGVVVTDANGLARVKYLAPAKYGVQLDPPEPQGACSSLRTTNCWQQTTTIEGTKTVDAWVKANEPPLLAEFGPPTQHVFMGFIQPMADASALTGTATVLGTVVNTHDSRPPSLAAFPGEAVGDCWYGLNAAGGVGPVIYAGRCGPGGSFAIDGVPPGTYQLVVWDEFLDVIIAFSTAIVGAGDVVVNLGTVQVPAWFARMEGKVCLDPDENGFCGPLELGMQDQAVNLRFRDGSVYQSTTTDGLGNYRFEEIFPFFNWLVAEVDFLRYKATGATVVVDVGGPVPTDAGWTMPSHGKLTPQPQFQIDPATGFATTTPEVNPNTGNNLSRTETGPVLLQGFQGFAGLTNVIDWGKAIYGGGQNGGVSGIVHYASTRAENDPRYAAADNWEPGIPRVEVALYRDFDGDGGIDAPQFAATTLSSAGYAGVLADVDNWPFDWSGGGAMGPEDLKRSTRGGAAFDLGDAVDVAWTDSFDDASIQGCQYDPLTGPFTAGGVPVDCFEGLPNFNQVRPAVFDGGYAFGGGAGKPELELGAYIVESVTPPGYEHVKEEDKNVDFGDAYVPSPLLLPPPCVGNRRLVPDELTLFPGVPTGRAGQVTRLCDRKQVVVKQDENAAVDFFMFTNAPVSAHIVALVTDDLNMGTDPASPTFGEKAAMGYMPIAIHDWAGVQIGRTYTDQFGIAHVLVPSTFSANVPNPSGYAPNMLRACVNSPGFLDAAGNFVADPFHDRTHSHTCYTLQYMPGKTTYLDTPVIPVAAFAGELQEQAPADCELPDGTPMISAVDGRVAGASTGGPLLPAAGGARTVQLTSVGSRLVLNPAWDGNPATQLVLRDYGFGANPGSVTLGGTALPIVSWSSGLVVANIPGNAASGQLELVRENGLRTPAGATLTIEDAAPLSVQPGGSIQAAIDAATPGQLVLVPPGSYRELLFLHKPVRLQGAGAGSTVIDGTKVITGNELQAWRVRRDALVAAGAFDLLPGQTPGPTLFALEEGPAVLVAGNTGEFGGVAARIDGFTITGATDGGGVLVNGHAAGLQISNNSVIWNSGSFGGGIRVGHALLDGSAHNEGVRIFRNVVAQNAGTSGVAGGIAVCTGADGYAVRDNYVCGNFSVGDGGGIAHLGLSPGGVIQGNTVRFNQAYQAGELAQGGGIFVGGRQSAGGGLSPGTGDVSVVENLVQGNQAATGDGGGVRLQFVNGQDVAAAPANVGAWYAATVANNLVVNNVAGMAGGGISLQDVLRARVVNNTVANNDSTATAMGAFTGADPNQSVPQPAGIVSWLHTAPLANAIQAAVAPFSDPELTNNIVWHNRSFFWRTVPDAVPPVQGLLPDIGAGGTPVYRDLGVLGQGPGLSLNPTFCLLTDPTGFAVTNFSADPLFQAEYVNGDRVLSVTQPGTPSSMRTFGAFDEGGNSVNVEFGPLTPRGDYHLQAGSPALGAALGAAAPATDFDQQPRPQPAGTTPDVGADERE
jgi:hypothetical protein